MSIFFFANATVVWKRATPLVLDSVAVAASHAGDRTPARESVIQVRLQGTPTGTVTVAGLVSGGADTEVLTWAGAAGYRTTRKRFTGSLTFTLSQAGGTTIEAKALGAGGDAQVSLYVVKGPGHPVTIEETTEGGSPIRKQGAQEEATHRFLVQYEDVWTPRLGDRVVNDRSGDVYEILKVEEKAGGLYVSHWACKAKRIDSKGAT